MLIAQISDSHVRTNGQLLAGRFDTKAAFDRLIESLIAQPVQPELILFSGDLGEDATEEEYAHVATGLRRLSAPVLAVPGNHDSREPMWSVMPEMLGRTAQGHLCICRTDMEIAIIGLDTLVDGAPHGELCPHRLDWLARALDDCAGRDTLMFMHHPPITTGLQDMDSMGLLSGLGELADLVSRHGNIRAILCGHMHRAIQGTLCHTPVRVSPSASHQIAFDLRQGARYAFSDEAPQYMMHLVTDAQDIVSHVVSVQ